MLKFLARLALPLFAIFAPAAAGAQAQHPALWVVKDADTTIYLFGTIHVLKPGTPWFDGAIKKAFESSDSLVTEIVLPTDPTEAQTAILRMGLDTSNPLSQKLPADKRDAYTKALTTLGMSPLGFESLKPWLAATQLTVLAAVKAGYDPNSGPDHVLTEAAKSSGKPVEGLETLDQQLGYLDGLSAPGQVALLTSTVDELPGLDKELGTMIADWSTAKTDDLARLLNEDEGKTPELFKTLIIDRDARWADWIAKRLEKPGTVFIAVGAGHLAGPDSVQAYLAKLHISATRVAD